MKVSDARALAGGIDKLTFWLRRMTPQRVSSSTITALDRLATEGPLRVSDLAARESISQPGVTVLVNKMAQAGYVERVPDPTDGRATLVRITQAGRALLAERLAHRAQLLRAQLLQLSDEDQAALLAALPAIDRLVATRPTTSRTTPS
jgi:DNA-binding MarR family transcriptional regulator